MIAKMKKLTFLVYHKEYDAFLKSIRDLGVVHVATKAQGSAEDAGLQESIRLSTRYAAAIKLLQGMNVQPVDNHAGSADRGMDVLTEMEDLQQQIQQVAHKLQSVEKEVAQFNHGEILILIAWSACMMRDIRLIFIFVLINSLRMNG